MSAVTILSSFIVTLLAIYLGSVKVYRNWFRTGEIITVFSFYFFFECIDIFLPNLMAIITGRMPDKGFWVPSFSTEEIALGGLVGVVSFFLIWIGYSLGTRFFRAPVWRRSFGTPQIDLPRARTILVLLYVVFLVGQYDIVQRMGGLSEYFYAMVKLRRSVFMAETSTLESAINLLSATARDLILMLSAVIFSQKRISTKKKTILVISVLGVLTSLTTFYRGTVFVYFIMLAAANQLGLRKDQGPQSQTVGTVRRKRGSSFRFKPAIWLGGAAGFFVLVGAVRGFLSVREWGAATPDRLGSLVLELQRILSGSGLYSLVQIVQYFESSSNYLMGSTIIHQLLRFVPRAIWASKPSNYGASEINAVLGIPPSTLEAVTIPGELFANFGYIGIVGAIIFGLAGGVLEGKRNSPRAELFYCTAGMSSVMAVAWFSVTGLMSWLLPALFMWILLKFVILKPQGR